MVPKDVRTTTMSLLKRFGLTEYEANIFYILIYFSPLVSGRALSVEEIARYSHVPLTRSYDVLGSLRDKQLVKEVSTKPKTYTISNDALKNLQNFAVKKKNEEISELKNAVSILQNVLAKASSPTFWREYRRGLALEEIGDHSERIKEEIRIIREAKSNVKFLVRTFSRFDEVEQCLREKAQDVKIFVLMQIQQGETEELAKRLVNMGISVKHWHKWINEENWIPTRWITVDGKAGIWHKWNAEGDFIEWALKITNQEIVEILDFVFGIVWNSSEYSLTLEERLKAFK